MGKDPRFARLGVKTPVVWSWLPAQCRVWNCSHYWQYVPPHPLLLAEGMGSSHPTSSLLVPRAFTRGTCSALVSWYAQAVIWVLGMKSYGVLLWGQREGELCLGGALLLPTLHRHCSNKPDFHCSRAEPTWAAAEALISPLNLTSLLML